jgi:hypothetical protein
VTPPGDVTLSAFPTPGGLPSETQTLLLGEFSAYGFYSEATAGDYTQYLPLLPVGTGLLLGIVPQPPLMDAAAEVMFTGTFLATMPGTALFRLGFLATLSDSPGQEAFGTPLPWGLSRSLLKMGGGVAHLEPIGSGCRIQRRRATP